MSGVCHVRRVAGVITDHPGYPAHTFERPAVPARRLVLNGQPRGAPVGTAQQVVDFLAGLDVLSAVNPEYLRACSGPEVAGAACH